MKNQRKKTIVLAEDYLDFHEFFVRYLESHFNLFIFSNGLDCYNFLKSTPEKIDLVLTDFDMPVMNGGQLAKKLQEDGCEIPIVIMSMHIPDKELIKIGNEVKMILDKPKIFNEGIFKSIEKIFEKLEIDKGRDSSL